MGKLYSPTAAARLRHALDAGHHPHCRSPPHAPQLPCCVQWSVHERPHTRMPAAAAAAGTSVHTTLPVTLL
jgi:hypothetical protein